MDDMFCLQKRGRTKVTKLKLDYVQHRIMDKYQFPAYSTNENTNKCIPEHASDARENLPRQ